MRRWLSVVALTCSLFLLAPAFAVVSPDEMLEDPAQEARARDLAKELRCLVCQNQSIDDSDAPLAADLRRVVREQILAGANDVEIKQYLTERYGDFVLLTPPVKPATYLLWAGPFALLVIGAAAVIAFTRRHRSAPTATGNSLSVEEKQELDHILKRDNV